MNRREFVCNMFLLVVDGAVHL